MVIKEEQERVRTLLSDTITLLCRNGLTFKSEFNISALIGITLDKDDVFLVDIRETIKTDLGEEEASGAESEVSHASRDRKSHKKRKRRHKNKQDSQSGHQSDSGSEESDHGGVQSDFEEPPSKNIKQEGEGEDESDDDDLVFVKDEPGITNVTSFSNSQLSQQTFSSPMQGQQGSVGAMDQQDVYGNEQLSGSWDGNLQSFPSAASTSVLSAAGQPIAPGATPPNPAAAAAQFFCTICGVSFTLRHNLQRHFKQKHSQTDSRVACPFCAQYFSYKFNMIRHVKKSHAEMMQQFMALDHGPLGVEAGLMDSESSDHKF